MSTSMDKIAKPGDEDLCVDVDGVTVAGVVCIGNEVLVHLTGGWGTICAESGVTVIEPGDQGECFADSDAVITFRGTSELLARFVARLEGWRDTAMPLRLCCAPGRMSILIEDFDKWLPLPEL